jgi:hypothetical protein
MDALPTTSYHGRGYIRHTGTAFYVARPLLSCLTDWTGGSVISYPASMADLLSGISNGTSIAVTDGSFKDGLGTAGYTIAPTLDSPQSAAYTLVNCTPGMLDDMDAYRSELGGICGILHTTNTLCLHNNIRTGSMIIGCDCLSAIQNITKSYEPTHGKPHHDLLSHIRYLIRHSPIAWTFRHVRGHQDDQCEYHLLDKWSQLNVDMDTLSKAYWQMLDRNRPTPKHLGAVPGQWSLWHSEYRFPSWSTQRATQVYYRDQTALFWNKRLQQPLSLQVFDWTGAAMALRRLTTYQRLWIPKWMCSVLPIGKNLTRWGIPDQLVCPRCGEEETHKFHVISCAHVDATEIRRQGIHTISIYLDESNTAPDLKLGLLSLIEAAISQSTWQPPPTSHILAQQTFASQLTLGSSHVLDGFVSPMWASTQLEHYRYIGRRSSGTQWISRVIRLIWQVAWDMWMHRRRVKDTLDDCALPGLHAALDAAVNDAYDAQLESPDPTLTRWFARPPSALHHESLDWKERWLEMIHSRSED